jgi:citrate/tricarballylate utilization protein
MEVGFLVLLLLTSVTGLALLALRETAAMGTLLLLHLAVVLALFVSLPYGKFMHGIYRFAALVKYSAERARP